MPIKKNMCFRFWVFIETDRGWIVRLVVLAGLISFGWDYRLVWLEWFGLNKQVRLDSII